MKFTVAKGSILPVLGLVVGASSAKYGLPILQSVLITAGTNGLSLRATDLEVWLGGVVGECRVDDPGVCAVSARKVANICKSAPDGADITFELMDSGVLISYANSRFKIHAVDVTAFPVPDEMDVLARVTVSGEYLKRAIHGTSYAAAKNDARYFLKGCYFDIGGGKLTIVATDGHRMAMAVLDAEVEPEITRGFILGSRGVQEFHSLLNSSDEKVTLEFGSKGVSMAVGCYTISSTLVEGVFPDYKRITPKKTETGFSVNAKVLAAAASRARITSEDKIKFIDVAMVGGDVVVSCGDADDETGSSFEPVEAKVSGEGDATAFNAQYMVDALTSFGDEDVFVTWSNNGGAIRIDGDGECPVVAIVMPWRK